MALISVVLPAYGIHHYLDLLTSRGAPSVVLQLLLNQSHTEPESQKYGSVPGGAKHSPKTAGMQLGSKAAKRRAIIPVTRRQESPRLDGADRRAYAKALGSDLRCYSDSRFPKASLKHRPRQCHPTTY